MLVDNSSLLDEKPLVDQLSDHLILNFFRFSTEVVSDSFILIFFKEDAPTKP